MADARFFTRGGPYALSRLLELTAAVPGGDADMAQLFHDVAPLAAAGADEVSFFDNIKYLDAFRASKAGACFVRPKFADQAPAGMIALVTEDPYTAYAKTAQLFYPSSFTPGVSPRAAVSE